MRLWLVRHAAPQVPAGTCYGALDVAADEAATQQAALALAQALPVGVALHSSPLQRCARLAAALCALRADLSFTTDSRLREMDFGAWEGRALSELPDLGPLSPDELARHAPPGGESFAVVCARIAPALRALPAGRSLVVAHAGTVRAALALALGAVPPALAFEVAPLSATSVRLFAGGASVSFVNRTVG